MTTAANVITANRFSITIDGYEIATFAELSGIVAEVEPEQYWEVNASGWRSTSCPGRSSRP